MSHCNISVAVKRREDKCISWLLLFLMMMIKIMRMNHFVARPFDPLLTFFYVLYKFWEKLPWIYSSCDVRPLPTSHMKFSKTVFYELRSFQYEQTATFLRMLFHLNQFLLKVQSFKSYDNKYMIASTQITNTDIFAFITVLVNKSLIRNDLFINKTNDKNC